MNALSEDIKDILEGTSGLNLTLANNLFVSEMPETPDNCVTLYDYNGLIPITTLDQDVINRPSLQVSVRGNKGNYIDTYNQCLEIWNALHTLNNFTINGTYYLIIYAISDPLFIKYDDNHRPVFTINFHCLRRIN